MTAKKHGLKSNLEKLDQHAVGPSDYQESPELPGEWFETAELREGRRVIRRGRPPLSSPKQPVNIRLSADVLTAFKSMGAGWQTRINQALREWLDAHAGK